MSKNPSEVAVIYQSAETKKIRLSLARNARPGAIPVIKQENSDDFVAVSPFIKPEPQDSDSPSCSAANTAPSASEATFSYSLNVPAAATSNSETSDFTPAVNVKQEIDNGTFSESLSIPLGDPSTRRRQYKVSAVREKIRAKVRPEGEMDDAAKKFHERMARMDLLLPIRFGRGSSLQDSKSEKDENERFSPSVLNPQEIHEPPEQCRGRLNRYCDAIGPTMFDIYVKYIEEQEKFWNAGQEYSYISGEAQRRQQEGESSEDAANIGTIPLPAGPMPRQPPVGLPDRVRSDVVIEPTRTGLSGVAAVRLMQRKKMHRCKVCKNRFVEKDIFERHLRDRHPDHFEKYKMEEELAEQQRISAEEEIKRKLAEAEERRNERLAQQYEMLHAENERRAKKVKNHFENQEAEFLKFLNRSKATTTEILCFGFDEIRQLII